MKLLDCKNETFYEHSIVKDIYSVIEVVLGRATIVFFHKPEWSYGIVYKQFYEHCSFKKQCIVVQIEEFLSKNKFINKGNSRMGSKI